MRVHLGGDHAAYELLVDLVDFLRREGHDVTNHGPHGYDALDDYPVFVLRAAAAVAADPGSFGVVLGGSGNGEQMAANKVAGIRAALCYDDELARLAREHNDAQVISIGARMATVEQARSMVADLPRHPVQRRPPARAAHRHGVGLRVAGHHAASTGLTSHDTGAATCGAGSGPARLAGLRVPVAGASR